LVPLTTPTLRVIASLELLGDGGELAHALASKEKIRFWWMQQERVARAKEELNSYARLLFPEDPAKIDFPFFVLGRWLAGFEYNREFLEKTIKLLVEKYYRFRTWPVRFMVERTTLNRFSCDVNMGAKSQLELPIAEFLFKSGVDFEFEPMQFWYAKEPGVISLPPPYTPDFLLALKHKGKKVVLEPHGVWDEFEAFLGKLYLFRKNYGEFFHLILIVPSSIAKSIQLKDSEQESYDQLWTIDEFQARMTTFRTKCSPI
jgi:hypothetical protein